MSKKIIASVFIATSLDGFIARKNGELDWLDKANEVVPKGEDCGFFPFMDSIDVLIMGRKTYEKVISFGQWPYGETKVIILSRSLVKIPSSLSNTVFYTSETPPELCKRLKGEGAERLYIDGGTTIQSFLKEKLINDITITTVPVILGSGIPLFAELSNDIQLKHIETKVYDFGFIQSKYEIEDFT